MIVDKLLCRAVIEVLGKPQEHVEQAMKEYMHNLKNDTRFKVLREDYADAQKQGSEFWATFVELEFEVNQVADLISFCFEYMPSLIEIIEPDKISLTDKQLSDFLNDLQAKLHQVDMVAKQVKLENDKLELNTSKLLKNYLVVLLSKNELSLSQLSSLTGVPEDKLGDYLDKLIDQQVVQLTNGLYNLIKKENI